MAQGDFIPGMPYKQGKNAAQGVRSIQTAYMSGQHEPNQEKRGTPYCSLQAP
jgi:hypothetical protein